MKLCTFIDQGRPLAGVLTPDGIAPLDRELGHDVGTLLANRVTLEDLRRSAVVATVRHDPDQVTFAPPVPRPPGIYCIGLNYRDHATESRLPLPEHPTVFARYASSLCGHRQAMVRPLCSDTLDFEGELAVVIGTGGRHIPADAALAHVFGYSVFNDGSVREHQMRGSQWTLGKNFDHTGGFGPFVTTADEVPAGASGLALTTRLNGQVVQQGNTADMVFGIAALIAALSEAITLQPGDVIVTGTPAGIGWARRPKLIMRHGDVCEVAIEGLGALVNPIRDESVS